MSQKPSKSDDVEKLKLMVKATICGMIALVSIAAIPDGSFADAASAVAAVFASLLA